MTAIVEEMYGGDPVYSERPELTFDNILQGVPFSLWGDGLVQTYRSYGASATYGRASVIGNGLLGSITVWRQADRDDRKLIVQHRAHRNTIDPREYPTIGSAERFTYWLADDDGREVTQIAQEQMELIVETVRPEPPICLGHESTDGPSGISVYCDGSCTAEAVCSGCGQSMNDLSHGWGECS